MAMRRSTRMQLGRAVAEQRSMPGRKMEIEYERWGEPEDRYDRQPRSNWRDPVHMGGQEPESRFRDRRGREHYNNGRYAPRAGGYGPYAAEYIDPYARDRGDDMRQIGFAADWDRTTEMRMGSDASVQRYNEMERMPGNRPMMGGYMAGEREYRKMDEQTAMTWARNMRNEDGSKAPHWTMDQVKQVMNQKNVDCDLPEFFAIMNALYADYDPILKKHDASTIDLYVDMAKAWIKDKDAVPNKVMAYYECVVRK